MSHYTVAVITKEPDINDIEELLAPFDENIEVEPYIYKTKNELIKRAKQYQEKIVTEFFPKATDADSILRMLEPDRVAYWRPFLEAKTDEEFYQAERGTYDEPDQFDEDGNLLSTYNPDSKWDWYQIGGRWSNSLKDKICNLWCDTCKIRNIDWDAEDEERYPFTSTDAVLFPNGEWRAPGEMGWWGYSSESDEEWDKWHENYKTMLLNATNPNWYITIVDCHI